MKNKGFSLIELIVSMSIIVLLAGFMIVKFTYQSQEKVLKKETQEIESNLKEAQAMAVSGEKVNGVVSAGGYGIYAVNDKEYYLYADLNENRVYNSGDTIIKTITLASDNVVSAGVGCTFLPYKLTNGVCYVDGTCGGNTDEIVQSVSSGEGYGSRIVVNLETGRVLLIYLGFE